MRRYTFTEEQIAEIESACKAATSKAIAAHLRALYLYAIGASIEDICRQTGASTDTIYKLAHRYRTIGLGKVTKGMQSYSASVDKYAFTQEQVTEISNAYRDALGRERCHCLEALYLCAKGESASSAARRLGISHQTVQRIVSRYKENGLDAVIETARAFDRKRKAALTPAQVSELREMLETVTDDRAARCFRALLLYGEGKTVREAAAEAGVATASMYNFINRYQENGAVGLYRHKRPFAAPKHKFTIQQKAEIESALKTVTEKRAAKKLKALWLRTEGWNLPEIAEATGIHTATLTQIIRKYQENGLVAVTEDLRKNNRPPKYSRRFMDYDEESRILKCLSPGKKECSLVPKSVIKAAFEEELGHPVSNCWICNLLKRHHWSFVSSWMPPEK